ncbi:hypothetical protein SGI36_21650, partial [Providencia rettgeri]
GWFTVFVLETASSGNPINSFTPSVSLDFLLAEAFSNITGSTCEQPDAFKLNPFKDFTGHFILWPTHIFDFDFKFLVKLQYPTSL